ncbi:MAG: M48 family metallopeptidase [Candidatus Izemoplasmatales bacterium]|nr:M48 family metallopeptidase [Candidatus Izemoplasmatales bacterium]
MTDFIFYLILGLVFIDIVMELGLALLNYGYRNADIPIQLEDVYNHDEYLRWKDYYMENFRLNFIVSLIKFIVVLALLLSSFFIDLNNWAKTISDDASFQTIIILGAYYLLFFLINLVSSYISIFKIENKYGFNKMTKSLFISDKIKNLILTVVFFGSAIYGLMKLYLTTGKWFFALAWSIISFSVILINLGYTKIIIPIFNRLRPLEESSLKSAINDFARSVGYEVTKISVMDASKRSTKLNAFFSGFGKAKRIVLYDTLIEKLKEEEIIAVLAHEIGHNKYRHIIYNLIMNLGVISIYILGLLLFFNNDVFSRAFGFESVSYGFSVIIYLLSLSPIVMIFGLLTNFISRYFEYQADAFAASNYSDEHMIDALKTLCRENYSNLTPHPLYVKFYYSHPTLLERINHIKWLKKDKSS